MVMTVSNMSAVFSPFYHVWGETPLAVDMTEWYLLPWVIHSQLIRNQRRRQPRQHRRPMDGWMWNVRPTDETSARCSACWVWCVKGRKGQRDRNRNDAFSNDHQVAARSDAIVPRSVRNFAVQFPSDRMSICGQCEREGGRESMRRSEQLPFMLTFLEFDHDVEYSYPSVRDRLETGVWKNISSYRSDVSGFSESEHLLLLVLFSCTLTFHSRMINFILCGRFSWDECGNPKVLLK